MFSAVPSGTSPDSHVYPGLRPGLLSAVPSDCFVAERNRNRTRAPGLPQRSPEFLPSLLAFLTESRTAKPVWCRVQEIRVALICGSF
jgi:hypothetical protein